MSSVRWWRAVSVVASMVFLFSCSLDYGDAQLAESLDDELAETLVSNASITVVRGDSPSFRVSAESLASFPRRNEQHLSGISFQEYNSAGELLTEGSAQTARIFTRNDDVEVQGAIRLHSFLHEARIEAEYLYHHHGDRRLSSREQDTVYIERDSGSWISGQGLNVDLRRNELSFLSDVQGEIIDEE